ncbi:MAG TPA: hypothetical protein ENO25_03925, partial [Desulfobacteraceae bacterium]|nr:hypothetical protein [Desulfobacteraceae bacterium]
MKNRREALKTGVGWIATGIGFFFTPLFTAVRWASAEAKKVLLPKGTPLKSLINKNPANLDARHLEVTPLEDFGTMGLSDYKEDMARWHLEVMGEVKKPFQLSYPEMRALPTVEREVLLICPGFFANHGRWKGISMPDLLKRANVANDVTHVRFSGPAGPYEKVEQFPIKDVLSNKVFLAYSVN